MIRRPKLIAIRDSTAQFCCTLDQTGCSCNCPTCDPLTDCIDCINLLITDINLLIGLQGNYNPSGEQVFDLLYPCSTFDTATNIACFTLDSQIMDLTPIPARYIGQVQVLGIKAANFFLQIGVPFSACFPTTVPAQVPFDDMQP